MFVGVCRLTLLASQCHSLKEKRSVLRTIKDRARVRFHIGLREVAGQDSWQRLVIGFSLVGGARDRVGQRLDEVVSFVEQIGLTRIVQDEREILCYGPEELGEVRRAATPDEEGEWIPEHWREALAGDDSEGNQ